MNAPAATQTQSKTRFVRISAMDRLVFSAMPFGAAAVILVAAWLEPDARGHGTHEQLGLMPCSAAEYLRIPCPFCGMTTSFTHLVHGDLYSSFVTQPGGVFLFGIMVLGAAIASFAALTGRWMPELTSDEMVRRYLWCAFLVLGSAWIYKIFTFIT